MPFAIYYAGQGRWRSEVVLNGVEKKLSSDTIQDGKYCHRLVRDVENAGRVLKVVTSLVEGSPDTYNGYPAIVTSLFAPSRRLLHDLIDGDSVLSMQTEASEQRLVIVRSRSGAHPITRKLRPDRDWLPVEVAIGLPAHVVTKVTAFQESSGHWFPSAGIQSVRSPDGGLIHRGFRATSLSINAAVDINMFKLPRLDPGVMVEDSTKNRVAPNPTKSAVSKPRSSTVAPSLDSAEEVAVENSRNSFHFGLVGLGVFLLSTAFVLARRRAGKRGGG